jgi:hypothetical protein
MDLVFTYVSSSVTDRDTFYRDVLFREIKAINGTTFLCIEHLG